MTANSPTPLSTLDDDQTWLDILENYFLEEPRIAVKAAKLFQLMVSEIERGYDGATHLRQCLQHAIRLAFTYTETFTTIRDQVEASLLEPDDPMPTD